jgi:protein phosphatase
MKTWIAKSAACSDRGRSRSNNEDAIAIDPVAGIFIVCDGMGGAAAGEIASRNVADNVLKALQQNPALSLLAAISAANKELFVAANEQNDRWGMGTTIVALRFKNDTAVVANVGDSRCYRLREDMFDQMTRDHSFVADQIRRGLMTREEAATSPMKNVITRAVGTSEQVEIDTVTWHIEDGDVYLLTTDGLTRELSDLEIGEIVGAHVDPEAACNALIAAANEVGGRDNISCVVVRIASRDPI